MAPVRGLAVAIVSVLLAALLTEGVLSIVDYPPAFTEHQRLFVEYDSLRGWRNVRGGHGRNATTEFAVQLDYNARGYRGPLHDYAKPPGTHRTLLIGDSFVEGYSVALHDRIAEVAERRLKARPAARPTEIIALGTGGYSTDQEELWLEDDGVRYAPDLVVLMFTENDIWFNARDSYPRGPKPLFRMSGDSLVLTNVPVPRLPQPTESEAGGEKAWKRAKRFVGQHSHLLRLVRLATTRTAFLQHMGLRSGLLNTATATAARGDVTVTVPAEFAVLADSLSPEADTAMMVTARLIARMHARSEAAGARFIAVMVPANEALYPPGAARSARYHRDPPFGDIERPAKLFATLCREARVACVDPTDRFAQFADSMAKHDELIVFPIDGHWNENGHSIAGQVLADIVRGDVASHPVKPGKPRG